MDAQEREAFEALVDARSTSSHGVPAHRRRRITVDWGDGTVTLAGEWPTGSCTSASGSSYPAAAHHDGNVNHHYAEAGSHIVTVSVTSVACDGSQAQTGTSTLTVTS